MNLKELDKKLSDKMNLTTRYPGYFSRWIFVLMIISLIALASYDVYLSKGDFREVAYTCSNVGGVCINPFYNNSELPSWVCEKVPCDTPYLEGGFSVGRNDWLSKNRFSLVFYLLTLAFIFNHIVYSIKNKRLLYRRE